tara:strand:- start:1107 stop:1565 length:459 start_codon:yes stop_codon:yes gene_type:complete
MTRYFLIILISFLFSNQLLAKNINIQENISFSFNCELEKKIIKNSEYNYEVFLAKDLDKKELTNFEIESLQPETLLIIGLSSFLSVMKLDVKVVNKDIVLFKAIDNDTNYSESGIFERKTGELVHEVTKNIKSDNAEKYITFYSCSKLREKV